MYALCYELNAVFLLMLLQQSATQGWAVKVCFAVIPSRLKPRRLKLKLFHLFLRFFEDSGNWLDAQCGIVADLDTVRCHMLSSKQLTNAG